MVDFDVMNWFYVAIGKKKSLAEVIHVEFINLTLGISHA
jgi:hypothetical protein